MSTSAKSPAAGKPRKSYALNQCALYKIGSKKRLAQVLNVDLNELLRLSADEGSFEVFELKEEECEFTGTKRKARWVQNPIPDLKSVLSRIAKLLARVQLPDFCHGAAPGRSYRTNAQAHVGAQSIATFDLKQFFPSTTSKQVFRFFCEDLQCAQDVAGLLTDLCTYKRALPTGAPSSPILAYWANRGLFEALNRRVKSFDLNLSVYIDDITLSGDVIPRSLRYQVEGIVKGHGHTLSRHKTRVFGPGQPKHVTGVVIVGDELRVPHARFRKARAIRAAFDMEKDDRRRALLAAKLCGLLGEAAFLDARFKTMADDSAKLLAAANAKLPARVVRAKFRKTKRARPAVRRLASLGPAPF